jgi:hypothetical protein
VTTENSAAHPKSFAIFDFNCGSPLAFMAQGTRKINLEEGLRKLTSTGQSPAKLAKARSILMKIDWSAKLRSISFDSVSGWRPDRSWANE